jgi:hypothetical protein
MSDTYSSLPKKISGAEGCEGGGSSVCGDWEVSSAQIVSYRSILDK